MAVLNAEKLVADYLREHDGVVAITGDRRVGSKTPEAIDTPWIRYTQLNRADLARPLDYFTAPYLQLDCYAGKDGGQPEASLLSRTVRAAMMAMPDEDFDDAIVTDVECRGDARIPDVQLDNRERFILSFLVRVKPRPA